MSTPKSWVLGKQPPEINGRKWSGVRPVENKTTREFYFCDTNRRQSHLFEFKNGNWEQITFNVPARWGQSITYIQDFSNRSIFQVNTEEWDRKVNKFLFIENANGEFVELSLNLDEGMRCWGIEVLGETNNHIYFAVYVRDSSGHSCRIYVGTTNGLYLLPHTSANYIMYSAKLLAKIKKKLLIILYASEKQVGPKVEKLQPKIPHLYLLDRDRLKKIPFIMNGQETEINYLHSVKNASGKAFFLAQIGKAIHILKGDPDQLNLTTVPIFPNQTWVDAGFLLKNGKQLIFWSIDTKLNVTIWLLQANSGAPPIDITNRGLTQIRQYVAQADSADELTTIGSGNSEQAYFTFEGFLPRKVSRYTPKKRFYICRYTNGELKYVGYKPSIGRQGTKLIPDINEKPRLLLIEGSKIYSAYEYDRLLIFSGLNIEYNNRPYFGRSWAIFSTTSQQQKLYRLNSYSKTIRYLDHSPYTGGLGWRRKKEWIEKIIPFTYSRGVFKLSEPENHPAGFDYNKTTLQARILPAPPQGVKAPMMRKAYYNGIPYYLSSGQNKKLYKFDTTWTEVGGLPPNTNITSIANIRTTKTRVVDEKYLGVRFDTNEVGLYQFSADGNQLQNITPPDPTGLNWSQYGPGSISRVDSQDGLPPTFQIQGGHKPTYIWRGSADIATTRTSLLTFYKHKGQEIAVDKSNYYVLDTAPPSVDITLNSNTVSEDSTDTISVTATLSEPVDQEVTVYLSHGGFGATANVKHNDFGRGMNVVEEKDHPFQYRHRLTIPKNATTSTIDLVQVRDDAYIEGDETFAISIVYIEPETVVRGLNYFVTGTISDNDVTASLSSENLITNGDFEASFFPSWQRTSDYSTLHSQRRINASLGVTTSDAPHGTFAFRFKFNRSSTDGVRLYQEGIQLDAEAKYTLVFDAKSSSSRRKINVTLEQTSSPDTATSSPWKWQEADTYIDTIWKKHAYQIDAAALTGTNIQATFSIMPTSTWKMGDELLLDNISLTKNP